MAVGVVLAPHSFVVEHEFPGVADSKKLTERKREALYELLEQRAQKGDLQFCVRFSSSLYIDTYGIVPAVRRAAWSGVRELAAPADTFVKLDGLLKAPPEYAQETIVHGDALVPIISLASVAAKVTRDRLMQKIDKKYPGYGFAEHKGYGTKAHLCALQMLGLCEIHRRSFCKSVANSFDDTRARV